MLMRKGTGPKCLLCGGDEAPIILSLHLSPRWCNAKPVITFANDFSLYIGKDKKPYILPPEHHHNPDCTWQDGPHEVKAEYGDKQYCAEIAKWLHNPQNDCLRARGDWRWHVVSLAHSILQ